MARKEFGSCHKPTEPVAVFEFNRGELEWLESLIPDHDGFRKDVREAIDWAEQQESLKPGGPGLAIVVTEVKHG